MRHWIFYETYIHEIMTEEKSIQCQWNEFSRLIVEDIRGGKQTKFVCWSQPRSQPGKSPWERGCVEIIQYREEKSVCADKQMAARNLICLDTDNDSDAIEEIQMRPKRGPPWTGQGKVAVREKWSLWGGKGVTWLLPRVIFAVGKRKTL